jgi:hypothetical protein
LLIFRDICCVDVEKRHEINEKSSNKGTADLPKERFLFWQLSDRNGARD